MFKNLFFSLITKGTVAFINFFILVLSSRYLGVSSRGEISIFLLNITVIQMINEIYTGYSIVHFIPKFALKKIVTFGFFFSFIFCSLSNFLVCALNKQVQGYEWMGYFITVLVILNSFNCVVILGKEQLGMYNFLSFLQPFLLSIGILIYVFILRKFTFEAYAMPLLFSFSISLVISTVYVFKRISAQPEKIGFDWKPIFINGLVFQASALVYIFINRYSYYLLQNIADVGLYASSSSFMEALLIIANAVSPVLLARVANQTNAFRNVQITLVLSKASFIFSVLGVCIVFLLPDSFFLFILGQGFTGIKKLMMLYAPGILMISLAGPINYYFSAIGKQKLVLFCYSVGFIFTLCFAPLFIHRYGIAGAAYNASLSCSVAAFATTLVFMKINNIPLKRFFAFGEDYQAFKAFAGKTEIR